MMISIKNISDVDLNFSTLLLEDMSIGIGETKQAYNNNSMETTLNTLESIQMCGELRAYIQGDQAVLVVNGVEGNKAQSLNLLEPVINF